jgi:hypothetical protein
MTPTLERIIEARDGIHGQHQQVIAAVLCEVGDTLLRKNADYGSSVFKSPVLCPQMPPDSSILVRLSDKVERLQNLLGGSEPEVTAEPISDTMEDLIGYAVLWLTSQRLQRADAARYDRLSRIAEDAATPEKSTTKATRTSVEDMLSQPMMYAQRGEV